MLLWYIASLGKNVGNWPLTWERLQRTIDCFYRARLGKHSRQEINVVFVYDTRLNLIAYSVLQKIRPHWGQTLWLCLVSRAWGTRCHSSDITIEGALLSYIWTSKCLIAENWKKKTIPVKEISSTEMNLIILTYKTTGVYLWDKDSFWDLRPLISRLNNSKETSSAIIVFISVIHTSILETFSLHDLSVWISVLILYQWNMFDFWNEETKSHLCIWVFMIHCKCNYCHRLQDKGLWSSIHHTFL